MAEKKSEKSPAKKPGRMCDQCELIDGFPGARGRRFESYAAGYRVESEILRRVSRFFSVNNIGSCSCPGRTDCRVERWAVEGRLTELTIEALDTEPGRRVKNRMRLTAPLKPEKRISVSDHPTGFEIFLCEEHFSVGLFFL